MQVFIFWRERPSFVPFCCLAERTALAASRVRGQADGRAGLPPSLNLIPNRSFASWDIDITLADLASRPAVNQKTNIAPDGAIFVCGGSDGTRTRDLLRDRQAL
jgi:hypothetical protein